MRIEEEKKKQAATVKEGLSYQDAINRMRELKKIINSVDREIEAQKEKAVSLVGDDSPRGEFETQQEYNQRLLNNKRQRQQVADEYETLKAVSTKVYVDELNSLTSKRFAIGKERLSVKLGVYNVDGGYFPVDISEGMSTNDPCDKSPETNSTSARLYAIRDEAKRIRENESLLDIRAGAYLSADQKLAIDKISLIEGVSNKSYDIAVKMTMSVSARTGPSKEIGIYSGDCNKMIFIKGGTFQMGDTFGDGEADEKPVHTVTVSDFYMSKYEVTQREWQEVMGSNPSYFKNCDDCPVESVSWNDVKEFIRKLNQKTGKNYRLPYEAEWEYAARSGGRNEKYAGTSSNPGDVAWYSDNSGSKTHPVGQKSPNGLGIYDLTGNVWEWCEDWYSYNYYSQSSSSNPKGPSSGTYRVRRGGSWDFNSYNLRSSYRSRNYPDYRSNNFGFRLVSE